MIVGLIIVLALTPATWLVAGIVGLELAALALVVIALMEMLDEGEVTIQCRGSAGSLGRPSGRASRPV